MEGNIKRFIKMRRKVSKEVKEELLKMRKKCCWCDAEYSPRDLGWGRDNSKRFKNTHFCSKSCRIDAQKGKSFTEWGVYMNKIKGVKI